MMVASSILKIGSVAYICMKFCTVIKNDVLLTILPTKLTSDNKVEHGAGHHFEIHFYGHNSDAVCTYLHKIRHRDVLKTKAFRFHS